MAFAGNLGDGIHRSYALGVKYEARGMLAREGFGTSSPLWHKRQYNVRGQVWNIQLGAGASATGENHSYPGGRVQLYYGGAAEGQSSATNNGNVTAQYRVAMSGAGGGPLEWWEGYSYDALNRLTQVTEYSGATGWQATGQQAYVYDRWGNRTVSQSQTWGTGIPKPNLAIETATNRLLPGSGQTGGFAYDAAGNMTTDTVTVAGGGQRYYDAENRLWKAQNGDGSFTEYRYDGDGRRIKRFVNANAYQQPETWQVYGMDGELLAEYRQGYAPFVPTKEYGYRNGQLLITAANGDEQRLTNYVKQLYYRAGGYNSTDVQFRVNTLANAGAQGELPLREAAKTVVRQIYQASSLPAADFVAALYLGALQRYGDPGGLAYWTSIAQSDRNGVIEAFVGSGEFNERVQVLYGREVNEYDRTDKLTHYLYNVIEGRGATATERDARRAATDGANVLGQSSVVTNAKDFARSLFNGAEYAARNRTNSEFVSDLYYAFLRYAPDAGGWNYWTGEVGNQGRTAILEAFLNAGAFDVQAGALYREVLWLVPDHLGTPRMIAERSGQPAGIKHHDYLPFGEELFSGISGRDASHGYGTADSARNQFTLKERDIETGLDYFLTRYYSSTQGRYISTDQPFADQHESDPQSWNLYPYVGNNPLKYNDPLGLWKQVECSSGQCWQWEQGDDWSSLGVDAGIGDGAGRALGRFFSGTELGADTVVDVSGFGSWFSGLNEIDRFMLREYDPQPPMGGGLKIVGSGARAVGKSLIGRFVNWVRGGSRGATVAAGFANGITREVLEQAAADPGPVIQVITNQTGAPQLGRGLSVAVGEGAGNLANAAGSGRQTFTARIPKALIERLRDAGLIEYESKTMMVGNQFAGEIRFKPEAAEFLIKFFQ